MPRDTNFLSKRDVLSQVDSILVGSGLVRSPSLFNASALPLTLVNRSFCVSMQTRNTGAYREGSEESARVQQELTLSVLFQVKPKDQFSSLLDAGDAEEKLMTVMMDRSNFPYAVVSYVDTRTTPTPTREYLVVDVRFTIEHDWAWAGLNP